MKFLLCLLIFFISPLVHAKVVRYELTIHNKTVNYTGKKAEAIAINNQIPAPLISATVGDILEVAVENKMNEDSSIHWHGILLPNDQDGVPYLTTPPIKANSSLTYRFKVKHPGTYWYHSHTDLQEQRGLYGPIIFHPKGGERIKTNRDYTVVLSDWTNENPNRILANLKKDGDWYALKKNSVQSWNRVIAHGLTAVKNRLHGAWTRMGPMDLSDVGYDLFLANGKKKSNLQARPGERVRLRLINAAASSYFYTEFAGGNMTLVGADGMDVEPIKVKRLKLAIAETYDVIVKTENKKSYELRSTSEDGTGFSSVFIGEGEKVLAPDIPRPNLFMTDHSQHGSHLQKHKNHHQHHDSHKPKSKSHKHHNQHKANHKYHSQHGNLNKKAHKQSHQSTHKTHHEKKPPKASSIINNMTDYKHLRAVEDTSQGEAQRIVTLRLTGNMERYTWSFNNKTLLESDKILIKKGETVKFILINETMMHHPLHLHGHFFRVLNGQGKRSPLKHTVNVPAMETVEMEFKANEEKDWFFHCHNLYHMKTGMSRVVSYGENNKKANRELFSKLSSDSWYFFNDISLMSNMIRGKMRISNTRNALELEYDYNYRKNYDLHLIYLRNFTRFLDFYGGLSLEDHNSKPVALLGLRYVLPLLIEINLEMNSNLEIQMELESHLQLLQRGRLDWEFNLNWDKKFKPDKDYRLEFSYEWNKNFSLTASYDSEFKQGAGVRFKF